MLILGGALLTQRGGPIVRQYVPAPQSSLRGRTSSVSPQIGAVCGI